jgi:mono/diheme cytochrome c family protein
MKRTLFAWVSTASTPALVQQQDAGKAVFARVCESCHGPAGAGGQGPALVPFKKDLPELIAIVRQGVGLMPAIPRSEMSDAEIEQVHAYLKSLTTADAFGRYALVRHR